MPTEVTVNKWANKTTTIARNELTAIFKKHKMQVAIKDQPVEVKNVLRNVKSEATQEVVDWLDKYRIAILYKNHAIHFQKYDAKEAFPDDNHSAVNTIRGLAPQNDEEDDDAPKSVHVDPSATEHEFMEIEDDPNKPLPAGMGSSKTKKSDDDTAIQQMAAQLDADKKKLVKEHRKQLKKAQKEEEPSEEPGEATADESGAPSTSDGSDSLLDTSVDSILGTDEKTLGELADQMQKDERKKRDEIVKNKLHQHTGLNRHVDYGVRSIPLKSILEKLRIKTSHRETVRVNYFTPVPNLDLFRQLDPFY
jgi:hypothetical protein